MTAPGSRYLGPNGHRVVRKKEGRLENLEKELADGALAEALALALATPVGQPTGRLRIATRTRTWAPVVGLHVIHNGIFENYLVLREELSGRAGVEFFQSDTDTEVLAHLLDREDAVKGKLALPDAMRTALGRVRRSLRGGRHRPRGQRYTAWSVRVRGRRWLWR